MKEVIVGANQDKMKGNWILQEVCHTTGTKLDQILD